MAAPDMSIFLSAFQFGTVTGAVLSIAAGLVTVFVVMKGICFFMKTLAEKDICGIEGVARDAGDIRPPRPRPFSTSVKSSGLSGSGSGRFKC